MSTHGKFARRRKRVGIVLAILLAFTIAAGEASVANAETIYDVTQATWPANLAEEAAGISYEESGGYAGGCGNFGFLTSTAISRGYTCAELSDYYVASRAAYALYQEAGWSPWTTYPAAPSSIAAAQVTEAEGTGGVAASVSTNASPRASRVDNERANANDRNALRPARKANRPDIAVDTRAPASRLGTSIYIVRSGDTLCGIADFLGFGCGYIIQHNPQLGNPNLIFVGERVHY